ncbi:MAG: DUF192 domain-containing protein [Patescibacteria group bacterium]
MISKSTIIILFVAIVFGVIFWYSGGSRISDEMPYYLKQVVKNTATVKIHDATYHMEIAQTPAAREKGLSNRSFLDPDKGMIFVFPTSGIYPFTMANTLISLDIIWIKDNTIVFMAQRAQPHQVDIIPTVEANYVLELNGGKTEGTGIAVGDTVDIIFDSEVNPR